MFFERERMKNKKIRLYIGIAAGVIVAVAAAIVIIFCLNPAENNNTQTAILTSIKTLMQSDYKVPPAEKSEEPETPTDEEPSDDNDNKAPEEPEKPAEPTKSAEEMYAEAKSKNDSAQKRLSNAQSAYNSAKQAYEKASTAAADAVNKEKLGLKGFLESRGSTKALKWFNSSNYKYANLTKIGDPKDATSFSSVRRAIKTIESYNNRRASMGLAALKIDDGLMAMAAVQANTARTHLYHNEYRTYEITECIAAQCSNPLSYWFDSEKKIYDNAVAKDPKFKNIEIRQIWQLYDEGDPTAATILNKASHYLNIISEETTLIGAGAAYKGSTPYDVTDAKAGSGGEDVASWKRDFENYAAAIESKTKEVSGTKSKLDKAEKELNNAKSAAKNAEANLKTLQ